MQKIYRSLFFLVFIGLIFLSVFNINDTRNKGNALKFYKDAPQTLELNDDLYVVLPSNSDAEYVESFGAKLLKDNEKIMIFDKGMPEIDAFFNFNSSTITNEKDIIVTMRQKIGLLFKQVMENSQIDSMTINTAEKVAIESLLTIKSDGVLVDSENNKEYHFIAYSFIFNDTPYYIMCIDITNTQEIDLVKYLIPENFIK